MGRRKKEKWKFIKIDDIKKDYYEISTWGRIRNINGKYLSYYEDKDGYLKCTLSRENGKKKHYMVHRLVAIHFIPNPDNKPQVNHLKPHDKHNLYVENFEWVTLRENNNHSLRNNLQIFVSCSAHGMSTLTNEDVHKICKMFEEGYSNKEVCKAFGFTNKNKKEKERFRGVIKHIRARKTWIPISRNYKF